MADLLLPRRFYNQPQGAVSICGKWLSKGISGAFLPTKTGMVDAVTGKISTASSAAVALATEFGSGLAFPASLDHLFLPSDEYLAPKNAPWSFGLIVKSESIAGFRCLFYLKSSGSTYSFEVFSSNYNSTYQGLNFGSPNTWQNRNWGGYEPGNWYFLGFSHEGVSSYPKLYVNGYLVTTDASSVFGTDGKSQVNLLSDTTANQQAGATVLLAISASKELTPADWFALYKNPWQIFKVSE